VLEGKDWRGRVGGERLERESFKRESLKELL
jgi:hypothetical protein